MVLHHICLLKSGFKILNIFRQKWTCGPLVIIANQGTVFYSMLAKNLLWNCTKDTDLHYATYLKKRENGFPQFEVLDSNHKELLYCLLDPVASNRYEATQVLEKQWVKDIRVCRGEFAKHHQHL